MTREQIGWLAAMIDGEGFVTMAISFFKRSGHHGNKRPWYVPHVAIANSDPAIVAELYNLLDALGVRYHASVSNVRKGHFGKKDVWQIVVHHFDSITKLLGVVGPHLISIKKAKAELMLRWIALRLPKRHNGSNAERAYTDEEHRLAHELRALSNTGNVVGQPKERGAI